MIRASIGWLTFLLLYVATAAAQPCVSHLVTPQSVSVNGLLLVPTTAGGAMVVWRDNEGSLRVRRVHRNGVPDATWDPLFFAPQTNGVTAFPNGDGGVTFVYGQPSVEMMLRMSATGALGVPERLQDARSGKIVSDLQGGVIYYYNPSPNIHGVRRHVAHVADTWDRPITVRGADGNVVIEGLVSDNAGGAIVVYSLVDGNNQHVVYATHVLAADGQLDPAWPETVRITPPLGHVRISNSVFPDGQGGALVEIVTDQNDGPSNLLRVASDGTVAWPFPGIALSREFSSVVQGDGTGGVVILDGSVSGHRLRRFDASAFLRWETPIPGNPMNSANQDARLVQYPDRNSIQVLRKVRPSFPDNSLACQSVNWDTGMVEGTETTLCAPNSALIGPFAATPDRQGGVTVAWWDGRFQGNVFAGWFACSAVGTCATPVSVSDVRAVRSGTEVEISWRAEISEPTIFHVSGSSARSGPYERLEGDVETSQGQQSLLWRSGSPSALGARSFRISHQENGIETFDAETDIEPAQNHQDLWIRVLSGPSVRPVQLVYQVPSQNSPSWPGVTIRILDVAGREVQKLTSVPSNDGRGTVWWHAQGSGDRRVGAGVYIAEISTPPRRATVKILL